MRQLEVPQRSGVVMAPLTVRLVERGHFSVLPRDRALVCRYSGTEGERVFICETRADICRLVDEYGWGALAWFSCERAQLRSAFSNV